MLIPSLYQPLFLQTKEQAVPNGLQVGSIPPKGEQEEAVRPVQRSAHKQRSHVSVKVFSRMPIGWWFPYKGVDPFRRDVTYADPSAGQSPAEGSPFSGKGRDGLQQGDGKAFIGLFLFDPVKNGVVHLGHEG